MPGSFIQVFLYCQTSSEPNAKEEYQRIVIAIRVQIVTGGSESDDCSRGSRIARRSLRMGAKLQKEGYGTKMNRRKLFL